MTDVTENIAFALLIRAEETEAKAKVIITAAIEKEKPE